MPTCAREISLASMTAFISCHLYISFPRLTSALPLTSPSLFLFSLLLIPLSHFPVVFSPFRFCFNHHRQLLLNHHGLRKFFSGNKPGCAPQRWLGRQRDITLTEKQLAVNREAITNALVYAKDKPAQSMSVLGIMLTAIFGPGWMLALPLKALGFGAAGPIAGRYSGAREFRVAANADDVWLKAPSHPGFSGCTEEPFLLAAFSPGFSIGCFVRDLDSRITRG